MRAFFPSWHRCLSSWLDNCTTHPWKWSIAAAEQKFSGECQIYEPQCPAASPVQNYALGVIPEQCQAQALQMLYVCTGCDYVFFFQGIGKASFLNTFFWYASFITDESLLESISRMTADPNSPSFFSFLWLVGCAYFTQYLKAHWSGFQWKSPETLTQLRNQFYWKKAL